MKLSGILLAAGSGSRMEDGQDKLFRLILGKTPLRRSMEALCACGVEELVICASRENIHACLAETAGMGVAIRVVLGGAFRQDSVFAGLCALSKDSNLVLVHDAARCCVDLATIKRCIKGALQVGSGIASVPVKDSIRRCAGGKTALLDRDSLYAAQTPQAFRTALLRLAHNNAHRCGYEATDDAALVEYMGRSVHLVEGSYDNIKLTTQQDYAVAETILRGRQEAYGAIALKGQRIGAGYDVHRLAYNRKLILGGVEIPFKKGLVGHSDADVLTHAVMDALLGAAALGDIGRHFPDRDSRYRDADSLKLLHAVKKKLEAAGYYPSNLDACIMAQEPKMAPHIFAMERNIARELGILADCVNIKATTTEGLGFVGRGQGIAANCVAMVKKIGEL
ncbi:MAG: 2-C-methyl-D-erythritol 2,4-cyclodiphosphate synthase [Christensenellales bacterium]|jgi:2-C-methyl-D-erythritol 4-phosphate cytidylyltransferase/2-C-methyl-D-erythritol 2,4-cyclodiphosphate synthase